MGSACSPVSTCQGSHSLLPLLLLPFPQLRLQPGWSQHTGALLGLPVGSFGTLGNLESPAPLGDSLESAQDSERGGKVTSQGTIPPCPSSPAHRGASGAALGPPLKIQRGLSLDLLVILLSEKVSRARGCFKGMEVGWEMCQACLAPGPGRFHQPEPCVS